MTPKEFIADFRLKKATMYLDNTSDTVAEIAGKTGFSDPIYFTRAFKQQTGLTPSKYREQLEQKKGGTETGAGQQPAEEKTDEYEIID